MSNARKATNSASTIEPELNHVYVLQRESGGEPFPFEWEGTRYEVPHVRNMDVFEVRTGIEDAADEDTLIWSLFRTGMGDEQWDKLRAQGVPQHVFANLVQAWRAHCGLTAGESSASTD